MWTKTRFYSLALSVASMKRNRHVTHLTRQCATADLLPGCLCAGGRGVLRASAFQIFFYIYFFHSYFYFFHSYFYVKSHQSPKIKPNTSGGIGSWRSRTRVRSRTTASCGRGSCTRVAERTCIVLRSVGDGHPGTQPPVCATPASAMMRIIRMRIEEGRRQCL